MKRTCQNCHSPLFDTDTVCWHCGQQQTLPIQQETSEEPTTADSIPEEDLEPELEPISSGLILFYGGLMITIILALLLVTRALGQSPILALKADDTQGSWIALTSPDKSFSIEIPATWDWHFQEGGRANSSFMEKLENDSRITLAVDPLGELVPDTNFLFVAQDDANLLVIARSERLNRLSPEQAAASLQAENFENIAISEVRRVPMDSGEERVIITLSHTEPPLICDQHLVPGLAETYLVAACTSAEKYNLQRRAFGDALNSFAVQSR